MIEIVIAELMMIKIKILIAIMTLRMILIIIPAIAMIVIMTCQAIKTPTNSDISSVNSSVMSKFAKKIMLIIIKILLLFHN